MSNILNLSIKNSPIKVAIFLAFLIGVLFRIYNLNYDYLWFDEIITFWISDPNLLISESYARYKETEAIPFLHYFLLKVCHQLFGYTPEVGRYFSAIFGILSILTLGYLAKQISIINAIIKALRIVPIPNFCFKGIHKSKTLILIKNVRKPTDKFTFKEIP